MEYEDAVAYKNFLFTFLNPNSLAAIEKNTIQTDEAGQLFYAVLISIWQDMSLFLSLPDYETLETFGEQYLIKMIRSDKFNFFNAAIDELLNESEHRERLVARPDPKKTITIYDLEKYFNRKTKQPMYSEEEKEGLSQIQSTTLINQNCTTNAYKHNGSKAHAGLIINLEEDALLNRLCLKAGGTRFRPFDHYTKRSKSAYIKKNPSQLYALEDLPAFIVEIRSYLEPNEVMCRIRWGESSKIGIFHDNLFSRLLALQYARSIERYTNTTVPILFYVPENNKHLCYYTEQMQERDCFEAIAIFENENERQQYYQNSQYEFLLGLPFEMNITALVELVDGLPLFMKMLREGYSYISVSIFRSLSKEEREYILENTINFLEQNDSAIGHLIKEKAFDLAQQFIDLKDSDVHTLQILDLNCLEYASKYAPISIIEFIDLDAVLDYSLRNKFWHRIERILSDLAPNTDLSNSHADYFGNLLHEAIEENQPQIVTLLLKHNANRTIRNDKGWHAVKHAGYHGYWECVEAFTSYPANEDERGAYGSALLYAAESKQYELAILLLDASATTNQYFGSGSKTGYTPLHFAVEQKQYDLIKALLEKGADANFYYTDKEGQIHPSAFKLACQSNDPEIILTMLDYINREIILVDEETISYLTTACTTTDQKELFNHLVLFFLNKGELTEFKKIFKHSIENGIHLKINELFNLLEIDELIMLLLEDKNDYQFLSKFIFHLDVLDQDVRNCAINTVVSQLSSFEVLKIIEQILVEKTDSQSWTVVFFDPRYSINDKKNIKLPGTVLKLFEAIRAVFKYRDNDETEEQRNNLALEVLNKHHGILTNSHHASKNTNFYSLLKQIIDTHLDLHSISIEIQDKETTLAFELI